MRFVVRLLALTVVAAVTLIYLFSAEPSRAISGFLGQAPDIDRSPDMTSTPKSGAAGRTGRETEYVSPERHAAMSGREPHVYDVPDTSYVYPTTGDDTRARAAMIMLVRNSELEDALRSVLKLERVFNDKFKYPWIFFNNEPFTRDFRKRMSEAVSGKAQFEVIPWEHWSVPSFIDRNKLVQGFDHMEDLEVKYSHLLSYRQMCRWNSGKFYHHPALKNLDYYWRVEPNVDFFCDVDYDVFRFMELNDKVYGFVISLRDSPPTIETLWPAVETFMKKHPKLLHANNSLAWLKDTALPDHFEQAGGYSTCHFWTNFEIANLAVWRDDKYAAFFDALDETGGFFYERWGDAPVHSVALGLFEDKNRIHFFDDIGYRHIPYWSCPKRRSCGGCDFDFTDGVKIDDQDCKPIWLDNLRTPSLDYNAIFAR